MSMAWRISGDLREWRLANALTQEEAARKAKLSTRTLHAAERGVPVRIKSVRAIARMMGRRPLDIATLAE